MKKPRLILASASPRRSELLRQTGVPFTIEAADIDESQRPREAPVNYVRRLATEKANTIARRHKPDEEIYVLGADTSVILDGRIYGKPADRDEACSFLKTLAGRIHCVITGYALVRVPDIILLNEETTSMVSIRPLTDDQISEYVATGEPLDKAGAYAAQGIGGRFVTKIEGSTNNVIGLPVELLIPVFRQLKLIE